MHNSATSTETFAEPVAAASAIRGLVAEMKEPEPKMKELDDVTSAAALGMRTGARIPGRWEVGDVPEVLPGSFSRNIVQDVDARPLRSFLWFLGRPPESLLEAFWEASGGLLGASGASGGRLGGLLGVGWRCRCP